MTPEMQALKDYMGGMGADCNPYPHGTDEHKRWQTRMDNLQAMELEREQQEHTA